ncbi:hypothetical protein MTO96_041848 [Rhipicephalus appendiculatus]
MAASSLRNKATVLGVRGTVSKTGGHRPLLLCVTAFLVLEGAEAFVVQDGEYFDIVNSSAPHVKVHVVLSERSRFVLNVILDPDELYGKFSFKYLEPIKGMRLTALNVDNGKIVQFASSRMDMGGRTAQASLSYILPNGTVLVNATIVVTPFSYAGDTICTNNWDCRRAVSCFAQNSASLIRSAALSDPGTRTAALGKCACTEGTVLVAGTCTFPSGCIDDSICTSGAICESTRCVCSSGSLRVGGKIGCERHTCHNNTDCQFWTYSQCARIRPGSTVKGCLCEKNTALLLGSCNPIENLGPCPYGRCTIEYSECDVSTSLCKCQKGYELRIYGQTWICEKKAPYAQTPRRWTGRAWTAASATRGEICDDGYCKCPKGKELKDLRCVEIKLPKVSNNLRIFLWLSAVMLVLIVVFITFGGCLYLLAQRAENEQMEIAKMFDPPSGDPVT